MIVLARALGGQVYAHSIGGQRIPSPAEPDQVPSTDAP